MVDQLARPTDKVEVYWFSEHPNAYVRDEDLEKYDATRFLFPNSYFDADYGNEGDMPFGDVMRSIELIGNEVIPALHEVKLQPYD